MKPLMCVHGSGEENYSCFAVEKLFVSISDVLLLRRGSMELRRRSRDRRACSRPAIDIQALSKQAQTVLYSVLLLKSLNLTRADRANSNSGASVAAAEKDAVCPSDPPSK